jgi:hypothetical protein
MYPPIGRAGVDTPRRGLQAAMIESRPTNLRTSATMLVAGCVRFSQKSHKGVSYWGLHCFHRFRSLIDGTEAAVACGTEGRWSFPRVVQVPLGAGVADALAIRACKRRA